MKSLLAAAAVLCCAAVAFSQDGPPVDLTLQDALSRAIEKSPDIGRSQAEIRALDAQRRQALAAVLPNLKLSSTATRNSTSVEFGSGSDTVEILPENDWSARIVLTQPIYAGNRERRAYEQTKLGVSVARETARDTTESVLLRVASNYLAAVEADRVIEIEQKNIELAQRRREQANNFYTAGETTKVDVLRADTAIAAERRLLANAEQQRELAVGHLRTDLGIDSPITVHTPEGDLPPLPDSKTLIARAEAERPEALVARDNLEIAELEIRKQRGAYFPVVSAEAGYLAQRVAFPASNYGYAELKFDLPIYQGGDVAARIAGATAKEIEAKLALEEAESNIREDVRQALVALSTAETNLKLAGEQLTSAQAEYDQEFEQYRAEEATSLDLADAENSLADARRAVATGTLDLDLAQLRVWYATGSLQNAILEKR